LQQAHDYFVIFSAPQWDAPTEKAINVILRLAHEQSKE